MSTNEATALQALSFEDHPVRITLDDGGEPWWVAKDVMEVLGYAESSNASRVIGHVPEQWRGVKPIHTLGGDQEVLCLSEQGLYFFLARSDKPAAIPFQMWIAGEVIPSIRKTGQYAVKQLTPAELMAAMANELVAQERRTALLETRVAAIEARTVVAEGEMLALPAPAEDAAPVTERSLLNRLVRTHAVAAGLDYQAVWNQLYREFRDRYHVDLKALVKKMPKGKGPLDAAIDKGLMGKLYATAWALYGKRA
jgi:prophage antirepressor-like protein